MSIRLDTPVGELKTVGKTLVKRLGYLGLHTVEDLIYYLPYRYDDFQNTVSIDTLKQDQVVTVTGKVMMIQNRRGWRSRKSVTEALLEDDTGSIRIFWFNQPYLSRSITQGDAIAVAGKVREDSIGLLFSAPQYEKMQPGKTGAHTGRLVPVYSTTAGVTVKHLRYLVTQSLSAIDQIDDWLPGHIRTQHKLISLQDALRTIHFPKDQSELEAARRRLGFEELFPILFSSIINAQTYQSAKAIPLAFDESRIKAFVDALPFTLTADQKKTAWKIIQQMQESAPMRRLVQGDVGSGKTVVAALASWHAITNEKRVMVMAPTEVLARQHYVSFQKLFASFPVSVAFLSSAHAYCYDGTTDHKRTKASLKKAIAQGKVDIVIGTHAVLQPDVVMPEVALTIVDEQHRFGVNQRQALLQKSLGVTPHFLSLTATPIPRSFALLLYGDLEVSVIGTLPAGRKPIITRILTQKNRTKAYQFIRKQLNTGRQAFVICPLIDESDSLEVKSVTAEFEKLQQEFAQYRVVMLHGKMKSDQKQQIMDTFASGETDMLVSTSVIEVGVDIPNATVMVIEDAHRFGLAQLHQFRGRVGRGEHQSYCFVDADAAQAAALERLSFFEQTLDGFALAQHDLATRGPGEVYGKAQSGFLQFTIARLSDMVLLELTQEIAQKMHASGWDLGRMGTTHFGNIHVNIHLE